MRCPFCHFEDSKVIDSRSSNEAKVVRRRRECLDCQRRFTTKEYVEESPLVVVKADSRREVYDQEKLKRSLQIACKKRPVATSSVDAIVSRIEGLLRDRFREEVPSREIGEMVIQELRSLDEVAYVRFASVYRNFQDKAEFITELEGLNEERRAVQ